MPRSRSRSRSRSPRRDHDRPRKTGGSGGGGFRWKEKPSRTTAADTNNDNTEGYKRGYRANRSPPRRRRDEDDNGNTNNVDRNERRERSRSRDRDRERRKDRRREEEDDDRLGVADKFGGGPRRGGAGGERRDGGRERTDKPRSKPKPAPAVAANQEPMIIVTVNDRLGTKAQIPCLASDPVKLFKAQVAARIGRQTHEIMLKRQGERPFKDQLTLEDYGVSNGVQLDLELDTGD